MPYLEEAWGSGDYLETLSFLVPDGEELALATPLPDHPYDADDDDDDEDEGGDWFSYNHAFPARPTLPLSSRLLLSPSSPTASVPPHTRHTHPDVFPTWDEDYDLDLVPLEPTELLLPDMNSLEYYTNLLAREKERQGGLDPERVGPTRTEPTITPTQTQPPLTPPPSSSPPEQGPSPPPTPTSTQTPPTTSRPTGDSVGPLGSPPSNTSGHLPSPPPPGPPASSPLAPERPRPPTSRTSTTTSRPPAGTTPTQNTAVSLTRAPPVTTPRAAQAPPTRQYLCNVTKPEMYLVRVGKRPGGAAGPAPRPPPADVCLCPCSEFQRFFSRFQPGQRRPEEGAEQLGGAAGSSRCSPELTWMTSDD